MGRCCFEKSLERVANRLRESLGKAAQGLFSGLEKASDALARNPAKGWGGNGGEIFFELL